MPVSFSHHLVSNTNLQGLDLESFSQRYISFFENIEGPQLLIVSDSGTLRKSGGGKLDEILAQLENITLKRAYVDGPLPKSTMEKFGFFWGK